MKIECLKDTGNKKVGDVIEVSDFYGKKLIESGSYAIYKDKKPEPLTEEKPVEKPEKKVVEQQKKKKVAKKVIKKK